MLDSTGLISASYDVAKQKLWWILWKCHFKS